MQEGRPFHQPQFRAQELPGPSQRRTPKNPVLARTSQITPDTPWEVPVPIGLLRTYPKTAVGMKKAGPSLSR